MRMTHIDHAHIYGTEVNRVSVYIDDKDNVVFLPLLWVIHLKLTGLTYSWKTIGLGNRGISSKSIGKITRAQVEFKSNYISDKTIKSYINHLFMFFKYLNSQTDIKSLPKPNKSELTSGRAINHYINEILPFRLDSVDSIKSHKSAIECYFNFLYLIDIRESTEIVLKRSTAQKISEQRTRPRSIRYISKKDRLMLLNNCTNKRDRIIIRLGYESGLRAKEIRGLLLNDFKANKSNHNGIITLFNELSTKFHTDVFPFTLSGKYTKGGRSRTIFFSRNLLSYMKEYYETERKEIMKLHGMILP